MNIATPPPGGQRIPVAVLGATGSVGQRMVSLLADHPWFEPRVLLASERSAGRKFSEAASWILPGPIPAAVADLEVLHVGAPPDVPLVFSALDASVAGAAEKTCAEAGSLVVSNARSHRYDRDVPLLVPEVNADHLDLLPHQSTTGGIITNPNCSTIGLVLALKPLSDRFGVRRVSVVTLQALSGAGLPGVPSMHVIDNVIPFIPGEEEKLEKEPLKILGTLKGSHVEPADLVVSAQCNRVPVLDGHTEAVSIELASGASEDDLWEAWVGFRGEPQRLELPSAPRQPIHRIRRPDGPQPRLHRDLEGGMATAIGRLRTCPILDFRFVLLSHNTLRGAAGGSLLAGELAMARGLVPGVTGM